MRRFVLPAWQRAILASRSDFGEGRRQTVNRRAGGRQKINKKQRLIKGQPL
jgi:hypothetical protein